MDRRWTGVLAGVVAAAVLVAGCTSSPPKPDQSPAPGTGSVPGLLVYAPPEHGGKVTLQTWSPPAQDASPVAALDSADALTSATVSPDGKRIAYVHAGPGALTVAALDGSGPKVLLSGVDPACAEPTWAPDGSRVVAVSGARAGTVAVTGGALVPFANPVAGCHVVWSGDGRSIAYVSTAGGIMVAKADGSGGHAVPRLGPDGGDTSRRSHSLMSLSADGSRLALFVLQGSDPAEDTGRGLVVNEIVDTATGATVTLPIDGELQQAFFLPSGGLLVRSRVKDALRVSLLSADLKVLATAEEPMTLLTAVLIGYAAPAAR